MNVFILFHLVYVVHGTTKGRKENQNEESSC